METKWLLQAAPSLKAMPAGTDLPSMPGLATWSSAHTAVKSIGVGSFGTGIRIPKMLLLEQK